MKPLIGLLTLLVALCRFSPAADRPNIVFILADDMGVGDTSSFGGNSAAEIVVQDRHFQDAPNLQVPCGSEFTENFSTGT